MLKIVYMTLGLVLATGAGASNDNVTRPGMPSHQWISMSQPHTINSFHLPPDVAEIVHRRAILEEIAASTGNREEFMRHHVREMNRVPLPILKEGLKRGCFAGQLQQGPFHTQASQCYYQMETFVMATGLMHSMYPRNNGLALLSPQLWNLTHLTELHLSDNQLMFVPESICNLDLVRTLYLNNNCLTSVPNSFSKLTQLNFLDLSGNRLTSVPHILETLPQLSCLYLNNNRLTSVPNFFSKLTQLSILYLNKNCLTFVPEPLGKLPQLIRLTLDGNPCTTLRESFICLSSLRRLFLSYEQWEDPQTQAICRALRAAYHHPVEVAVGGGRTGWHVVM